MHYVNISIPIILFINCLEISYQRLEFVVNRYTEPKSLNFNNDYNNVFSSLNFKLNLTKCKRKTLKTKNRKSNITKIRDEAFFTQKQNKTNLGKH